MVEEFTKSHILLKNHRPLILEKLTETWISSDVGIINNCRRLLYYCIRMVLYCFVLSPVISLGAVPHHHLALSVKEFTYSSNS